MTYVTFMFTLMILIFVSFVVMILDEKYDIIEKFIEWSCKKVKGLI